MKKSKINISIPYPDEIYPISVTTPENSLFVPLKEVPKKSFDKIDTKDKLKQLIPDIAFNGRKKEVYYVIRKKEIVEFCKHTGYKFVRD